MLSDSFIEQTVRAAKLVPDDVLAGAVDGAKQAGQPLADVLIAKKLVAERALYEAAASAMGVPFIDPRGQAIVPEVLRRISAPLAANRRVIAYEADDQTLRVAMEDPDDLDTIELLRRATNLEVEPALTTPQAITETVRLYHADVAQTVESLERLSASPEPRRADLEGRDLVALAEEAPIVRIVDTLLELAISRQASDIHIEPGEQGVVVRYRIDGVLQPTTTLPRSVAAGLIARIKILSNLKIDEHRLPQDGRFKVTTPNERIAVRVAIMPVYDGEKAVLRILRETGKALTLIDLGLRSEARGDTAPLAIIERNMKKPHGIIFVTGPTGSGKTTTLYAMMNTLNRPGVNIATIEDPIEYRMPGINQSQVQPKIGFTFAAGLRALLRQDPNIIMVGEIRDAETADIAVNAALTGHLVLATLHTNDAATSLTRLQEMGVPTFLVASTINCIIAQRLVRKLCEPCRKRMKVPAEIRDQLKARGVEMEEALKRLRTQTEEQKNRRTPKETLRVPTGQAPEQRGGKALDQLEVWERVTCDECASGYRGRVGIFEVLEVTPTIAERIQTKANSTEIHAQAVAEGMATMFVDGILKAVDGVTTVEEVLRVTRE
jgi:type IV pilus assembly protein PilB